jgi:hypothetical protein
MEPRDRLIRDGYIEFLRSKRFDPYFRKLHRPPRWRYILAVPMILSVAGIAVGLGLIASARLSGRKRNRIRQELISAAERSVPVMAYPLMANEALMRRKGTVAPALMIGTFETGVGYEEMAGLARKMLTVDHQKASNESTATVNKMFEDVTYAHGRRRAVPEDLTGGRRVYAFDLMMIGDYLPTDTLEFPLVPCLAEPGESGTIQMLPWWIVAGAFEG